MASNSYEKPFEDGRWVSKLEAAIAFSVTERTIENRIKSDALRSRIGEDGKPEIFLRRNNKASNIFETANPEVYKDDVTQQSSSKDFEKLANENDALRNKLIQIEEELMNVKLRHAQLMGESNGKDKLLEEKERLISAKDEIIQAKDQAINAANAAVMILENHKLPALDTSESKFSPPQEQKKGWFEKLWGNKP